MPYTAADLPFSGITPESSEASHAGAVDAEPRAITQTALYLRTIKGLGSYGLTDWEAAAVLHLQRSTINARRVPLVRAGLVYAEGFRRGPTGIKNAVWKAR